MLSGLRFRRKFRDFFDSAVLPEGWNHTQLSLIPKIPNPVRMQDMRPISLCAVQYKIISKILCNRLKVILPEVVSETQGAFVAGRLISDNIIIAHETINSLRTCDRVADHKLICLKLMIALSGRFLRHCWKEWGLIVSGSAGLWPALILYPTLFF